MERPHRIQHVHLMNNVPAYYSAHHGRSFQEFLDLQRQQRIFANPYGGSLRDLRNLEVYKPLKPNALDDYAKAKESERRSIRKQSGVKWVKVQQS